MFLNELWEKFLKTATQKVGGQVVDTWFKSVSILEFNKETNKLIFSVPNNFVNSWIKSNYLNLFKSFFPSELQQDSIEIGFVINKTITSINRSKEQKEPSTCDQKNKCSEPQNCSKTLETEGTFLDQTAKSNLKAKKSSLNNKYSFKNFIVGPNNFLAYSAAQAISKGFARRYNPLFIYGKTGLGKTHLLHCIGNEYKKAFPDSKVIYKSSTDFVEEFIQSVRNDKLQNFSEKYRKIDLLLIDDIQFFTNKEQTQEVFFNIFNKMYDEKKQIVLTSDTPPAQLSSFQDRLISRFSWGLIADVTMPTVETRIAILEKKAEELKIDLTRDVFEFIAENFCTNIREMEGALIRLAATTMLTFNPMSLDLAKKELNFVQQARSDKAPLQPTQILSTVLKNYGLSSEDFSSKKRDSSIISARQTVAYLLKKHTSCSLRTIGFYVGGRKHSTVLNALSKVELKIKKDARFSGKLKNIENVLY